jgi:hypothetical protein
MDSKKVVLLFRIKHETMVTVIGFDMPMSMLYDKRAL